MSQSSSDYILSGILGAVGFTITAVVLNVLFQFIIPVAVAASIIVAMGCFFGGKFMFTLNSPAEQNREDAVSQALKIGWERYEKIKTFAKSIADKKMQTKLYSFLETLEKILAELKRDPDDLSRARNFLNNHLESVIRIIETYNKLITSGASHSSIVGSLTKVNDMVYLLNVAAEKQLAALLTNDVMDLETELSVLKSGIETIG